MLEHATKDAIESATQTLLDSVARQSSLTQEDQTEIGKLDHEADSMEAALCSIYESLARRVADKRRQRNGLTLIEQLPPELLIKLFHATTHTGQIDSHFIILHTLARVCYRWATIIIQTPSLWAYIPGFATPTVIETALRRSQSAPLTVAINVPVSERGRIGQELGDVLKQVSRWADATVRARNIQVIQEDLEQAAPVIMRASILSSRQASLNLFGGQADQLRDVCLTAVRVPWHTPILSGLTSLEINNVPEGPSASEILHILQSCPSLTSLSISNIGGPSLPLHENRTPLLLPCLQKISLQANSPELYIHLLTAIRAPICTELIIESRLGGASRVRAPAFLIAVILPFLDQIKKIVTACTGFTFFVADGVFHCFSAFDDVSNAKWSLKLLSVSPREAFQPIVNALRVELAEKPIILKSGRIFDFSNIKILVTLDLLRGLQEVAVGPHALNIRSFFDCLRTPVEVAGVKRWRLPQLRRLGFTSLPETELERLLAVLQSRYGRSSTGERILPIPLEALHVACPDLALMEQLRDVVGMDVVQPPLQPPPPTFAFGEQPGGMFQHFPGLQQGLNAIDDINDIAVHQFAAAGGPAFAFGGGNQPPQAQGWAGGGGQGFMQAQLAQMQQNQDDFAELMNDEATAWENVTDEEEI